MAGRPRREHGHGAVAIYARFSSELQNARSCDDQVDDLQRTLVRDGETAEPLVFTDEATSGTLWDRPGLQALLREVEAGNLRELRVEHPDRLSRDIGDADRIAKLLRHHDVRLVCSNGVVLDGSAGASLTFGVTAVLAENYLRELGAKTLRGQRASARQGKATGGRLYGYRTNPEDKWVAIDPAEAKVVRLMFRLYAEGYGYARIARELNGRGIAPPRSRRKGKGWIASAIREQLRNPKYVGDWSFGVRQFARHPVTRKRKVRERPEADIIREHRPELAIVDRATWDVVQAKLAAHAESYRRAAAKRTVLHRRSDYLLSGLLRCGCCGALMNLAGGSTRHYYRCSANRKRGTCDNALSVREDVARRCILDAIADALWTPGALEHIRHQVAERLGELTRGLGAELASARARLAEHETRIGRLVTALADGLDSPTVRETLTDLVLAPTLVDARQRDLAQAA